MDVPQSIAQGQEDWAFVIGVQACVWGLPIIQCWKYRLDKVGASAAGSDSATINRFQHMRTLSTRESSKFVNSATDFLYSTAVLDLGDGPLVLTAPDFGPRWYGLQVLDTYMETLANLGTRTFGSQLPEVIIANRRDQAMVPAGSTAVLADSDFLFVVGRIAAGDREDLSPVNALQDALGLAALDRTDERAAPRRPIAAGSCGALRPEDSTCPEDLAFFEELGAVLKFVPPTAAEGMLLALLGEVGVSVEAGFDHRAVSPAVRAGLAKAVPFAHGILARKILEVGESVNGWQVVRDIGNYGQRYIVRALVALHGIWANVAEESLYFMARTDCDDDLLHGDRRYELRFPAGGLPPVDAFWSISYYDESGHLTGNDLNKHAVNSLYNDLRPNADGSTSVFIGRDCTQPGMQENWLPSHSGVFNLTLRCYNPSPELLSLAYRIPPLSRIG